MALADLPQPMQKQLSELPKEPGVYIFTDSRSRTVYVGKAVNLRSRVRSYFQQGATDGRFLFSRIVENTHSIDFIVCANELEALLLENNLTVHRGSLDDVLARFFDATKSLADEKLYVG